MPDIPPQMPSLAARSIDELWKWCEKREGGVSKLAGEAKLDGCRCILSKYGDDVRVRFPGSEELEPQHPELAEAIRNAPFQALVLDGVAIAIEDGEILPREGLAALPTGEPPFPAMLAAFDCLFLNEDLRQRPLGQRREALKAAIQGIKSPSIRLSPARAFSSRKELEILSRWAATRPGSTGLMVKDLSQPRQSGSSEDWALLKADAVHKDAVPRLAIEVKGGPEARAAFIAASPNEIEAARNMPLAGEGRSFFKKAYLEPSGLKEEETAFLYLVPRVLKRAPRKEEIEAWRPWLMRQLQQLNPEMVVALGKQAGEALRELADLTMPHPHAVLKHGDKGEVLRKASMLRETLAVLGTDCGCGKGLLGEEIRCPILKADVERRLVYSVIAEPDTVDAQGDVMSAETIEEMAHNFLLRSRKFDNRHDWKAVDAAPVESWIQREATVLLGEKIKAKSWVVGVKVFADHIWEKVLSKEYQSFSIGGRGVRVPRVRFG
ncbi:MAG TPA: XkdF-like putative serine protease domain-containing protein [Methanothrix sp.]|nr:XkdF-like putative serine protease domain-containing protein [Methanothrix sp.]